MPFSPLTAAITAITTTEQEQEALQIDITVDATMAKTSVLSQRDQKPPTKKTILMRASETPAQLRPLPSGLAAILEAEMALQENEKLQQDDAEQHEHDDDDEDDHYRRDSITEDTTEDEDGKRSKQPKKKRTKRKNSVDKANKVKLPKLPTAQTAVACGHPTPLNDPNLKSSIDKFGLLQVDRPDGWIGAYSAESRKARLERFRQKRKNRVWTRSVEYDVRQSFAVSRLRVKGRFVKKEDELLMRELMSMT